MTMALVEQLAAMSVPSTRGEGNGPSNSQVNITFFFIYVTIIIESGDIDLDHIQ